MCRCLRISRWFWARASIFPRRWWSGSSTWLAAWIGIELDMPSLIDLMLEGRKVEQHRPWPRAVVDASVWQFAASELAQGRWSLLGLWGEPSTVHMAIMDGQTAEIAVVSLDCPDRSFPSVGRHHPPALRLERTINDLFGLSAEGLPDTRPWLDHERWGVRFPLGDRIDALSKAAPYRFLPVEGDGLHQIAVGPVHAGIIEPGHFRFTASGETVVRLEQRLGYTHKGIEGLMTGASLERGAQLAGRVSGDSTVAYAYAFSRGRRSGARACRARSRGLAARAAGRARAARQSSRRHRRDLQRCFVRPDACALQRVARKRAARAATRIRPSVDAGHHRARRREPRPRRGRRRKAIRATLDNIRQRFPALVELYDNTASLQDRTVDTGMLKPRSGQAICRRRLYRPRFGPLVRRTPQARLSAL